MNEPQPLKPTPANLEKVGPDKAAAAAHSDSSADLSSAMPKADKAKPAKELSAEEQMALYEKELKENDWGHQPC
jgi:hypothetical protein